MLFTALRCPALRASRTARTSLQSSFRIPASPPPRAFFLISRYYASKPAEVVSPAPSSPQQNAPTPGLEKEKANPNLEGKGPSFYEKVGKPGIRKQVVFVGLTCALAFSLASTQTTVETENWTQRMLSVSSVWSVKTITNTDLKRAQTAQLIQGLRETLANIQTTVHQLPVLLQPWVNRVFIAFMQPYADASDAKRLCWKICLLNVAVWGAWKVKSWQPLMNQRFMHNPLSGLSFTLLTSMFSHRSAIHLICNCLALESFGAAAYYYLLREQNKAEPEILESTTSYHFLAFFISAGLFSGLVSHVVSAKFRFPRLVAQLASPAHAVQKTETWAAAVAAAGTSAAQTASKKKVLDILPSLGASGAIYAAVTMTALAFPDSQVALFIPPSYPINIQYGVGGLILLDTIGILRGWRLFDHWAHLGGAAFGVIYYAYGPTYWRHLRESSSKVHRENA